MWWTERNGGESIRRSTQRKGYDAEEAVAQSGHCIVIGHAGIAKPF